MNTEELLADRSKTHGSFVENAEVSQALKHTVEASPLWPGCSAVQKEALHNICQKMSRILTGDPNHRDSWDDIAGYATLASKVAGGFVA